MDNYNFWALVLRRMQWSPHFCTLYLAARLPPNCNIIVMSLVGKPLSQSRRQNPAQCFTLSTALRLGIQGLEVNVFGNFVFLKMISCNQSFDY